MHWNYYSQTQMAMTAKVKLIKKELVAFETMAFYFEKPAGFEFKAGQTMDLNLMDVPVTDAEGNSRTFTIAASPFEPDLMIATRLRDTAFKNYLKSASPGLAVSIEGPFGSFTLHNDVVKPAVFLAGGIGITPFFSMIKQATHDHLPHKIFLFYSNRESEDAPFLADLQALEQQNPNFKLVTIFTAQQGHLGQKTLNQFLDDLSNPIYYLAGPPNMVLAMRQLLETIAVNPDSIRFEEFAGY